MEKMPSQKINQNMAIGLYYIFKIIPMLIAGVAIYLGYRLFILGVTGQASLSVKSKDISGQLLNAAPGLFFAVGGIVAIIITVWKGVRISFEPQAEPPKRKKGQPGAGGFGGGTFMEMMDVDDLSKKISRKDIDHG
jgi:hypothetical protein